MKVTSIQNFWVEGYPLQIRAIDDLQYVTDNPELKTSYGGPSEAIGGLIGTLTSGEGQERKLNLLKSKTGIHYEVFSALPASKWAEDRIERIIAMDPNFFSKFELDELWLIQNFDYEDFVLIPYNIMMRIVEIAFFYDKNGKLPDDPSISFESTRSLELRSCLFYRVFERDCCR